MKCDCVRNFNKKLAETNTIIESNIIGEHGRYVVVATCKLSSSKRGRPTKIVASFCPFCGVNKLDDDVSQAISAGDKGE